MATFDLSAPRPARRELNTLTDEQLVALAASRCQAAFVELYDRHAVSAHSLALRIVRDAHVAEDVVQVAFLDMWRKAGDLDPARGSVRPWLLRIVHNRSIDTIRRRNVERNRTLAAERSERLRESSTPLPHDLAAAAEESVVLQDAISGLPSSQREVVELAYFGGLSHKEISARLLLPLGTVKGRMRLALSRLRYSLERDLVA